MARPLRSALRSDQPVQVETQWRTGPRTPAWEALWRDLLAMLAAELNRARTDAEESLDG